MIKNNYKRDIYYLTEPENKLERIKKQKRIISSASGHLRKLMVEKLSGKMGIC
jgi:hypothetical protein